MMLTMSADNYTRLKQGVSMSSWRTTTPRSRGMSKNSQCQSELVSMEVRGQTCCRKNRVCIERSAPLTSHQLYLLPRWVSLDSSLLHMQCIRYPLLVTPLFRMLSLFHRNSAPLPPPTRTVDTDQPTHRHTLTNSQNRTPQGDHELERVRRPLRHVHKHYVTPLLPESLKVSVTRD